MEDKPKLYKFMSGSGVIYESPIPGQYGGNKRLKIYGRLDCPSANRYLDKGYEKVRVFFANQEDARSAGFRPCAECMKEEYIKWKNGTVERSTTENNSNREGEDLQNNLTKTDYKKAIGRQGLSEHQIKLLNGWYKESKSNWATPELLRKYMGYDEIGRVNIDVGSIGKLIIDNLKLDPDDYLSEDKSQTAYWSAFCDEYNQEKGWHFSSDFFNAMIELHIINV